MENLEPIYQSEAGHCENSSSAGPDAKRARLDKRSSNEQETEGSSSVSSLTAPESPSNLSRSTASPPAVDAATHCDICPFVADSSAALIAHKKAHELPKGLINYKCAFCIWFSKKKPAVLEHMRLHTGTANGVEGIGITSYNLHINDRIVGVFSKKRALFNIYYCHYAVV